MAFPFAFMACGYVMGFIVSAAFAAIMWLTLHILGMAAMKTRETSYQGLVAAMLGPRAGTFISVSMTIYLFGACVAYLNIISDQVFESLLSKVDSLHGTPLANRQFVILLFTLFPIVPLCLMRSVKSLETFSVLAVVSIVYLAADVAYHAGTTLHSSGVAESAVAFNLSPDVFKSVPIICFALQCHLVYVPVFASLDKPSLGRMDSIAAATFVVCLALYLPVGVLGYLMFGTATKGDISENLTISADVYVVHACLAATAIFSYPLLQFVARIAVADLVWGEGAGDAIVSGEVLGPPSMATTATLTAPTPTYEDVVSGRTGLDGGAVSPTESHRHSTGGACGGLCGSLEQRLATPTAARFTYYGLTAAFILLTMGVAMAVEGIQLVLSFTGSTAAVVQIFVFPGLMYMKLQQMEEKEEKAKEGLLQGSGHLRLDQVPGLHSWDLDLCGRGAVAGWATIAFGITMGVVALTLTIVGLAEKK